MDSDSASSTSPQKVFEFKHKTVAKFCDLGIAQWLVAQCTQMGLHQPTAVQANCIPAALAGRDVIGCSRTGTGKTLAFVLPILQSLSNDPYGIYALVLTPTRELAFQIADQFSVIGKPIGLRECVVVGGRDMIEQSKEMARRPHVLIATPGRLSDHLASGHSVALNQIKFLVFDEADRLLDGQFEAQLRTILQQLPSTRQTLLFSATITDALARLHEVSIKKPFFWEERGESEQQTVAQLDQRFVLCPVDVKDAYLVYVVQLYHQRHPDSSVLIFAQTCREVQALSDMLHQLGFKCGALHSMIPQRERLSTLARFRSNRLRILLCTDVAARGLDIRGVELVINHNVPAQPKNYVHRVGRAARAGRHGAAITFVTQYDVSLVRAVEQLIKCELQEYRVSDRKVAACVTEVLVAKRDAEIKLDERSFGERREINRKKQMILDGITAAEVDKVMEEQKLRRLRTSKRRVESLTKSVKKKPRKQLKSKEKHGILRISRQRKSRAPS